LSSANENSGANWSQTYDCDRYGNRAVRAGSYIPTPALTPQSVNSTDFSAFNQSTNKIIRSGFGYDPAGNLTADPTTAANAMVYDGENRQISYTKAGVTTSYSYDGDGRRVKKVDSTGTIVFVYNAGGQLIAEYHSDPVPPPAGGGGTSYLTSDHLGSTRVVTDGQGNVKARHDYLPFGEELSAGIGQRTVAMKYDAPDSTKQKFTQKERDNESGLDYFLARYYSSAQGRFTSPDEFTSGPHDLYNFLDDGSVNPTFYADIHNPQSLNKYQYCYNNPLLYVDPDGHQGILDKAIEFGKQTAADTINGGLKTAYNAVISGPNTVNTVINAGLSLTGTSFRLQTYEYAQPETPGEKGAMLAGDIVLIYYAAKGASASTAGAEVGPRGAASGTTAAENASKQGVYEFADAKQPGKTYVGQSSNMPGRLAQHEASGKRAPGSPASTAAVQGGKTAREVAEQRRINQLGGTRSVPGSRTSNLRNPIGARRRAKVEEEHGPLN
jgi:RHS repeat-associated protein